jgi:putative nucleotide binding protein
MNDLPIIREENAIILDYLPNGYINDPRPIHRKTPIALALGKTTLNLLELVPKKEVFLQPYQEVYIGDGKRDEIHHVNGRIGLEKLTNTARAELEHVINSVVHSNQERYITFFNKAQPLSTRMHSLELLPGLGKKHMWEILEQREQAPFTDFNDLKNRVKLLPDPEKIVARRIQLEMQGTEKHFLFLGR